MMMYNNITAVSCNCRITAECKEKVRLEGLGLRQVGQVEVCEGGEWVSVCVAANQSSWRHSNAAVACREMGYSSGVTLTVADR